MNWTSLAHVTSRISAFGCLLLWIASAGAFCHARSAPERPSLEQVTRLSSEALAERKGYQSGDLVTQSDVKGVLKTLAAAGWRPVDHQEIVALALPDDDALVQILGTSHGVRFMRRIADVDLIYDRLDRICRVYGGQRMIADMAKLPDGQKLVSMKRPHGVPGLLDLLPKTASGKRRSIKDYDKPTGRIYNEEQLIERLSNSYQGKTQASQGDR